MKFFDPKSYHLPEINKWIPSADISECNGTNCKVTDEYSIRERECDTEEEANAFITRFLTGEGFKEIKLQ